MDARKGSQSRAYWLKTMHQWHWISSAMCLMAMVLFAATGFTLNHAADIEGHPVTDRRAGTVPAPLLKTLTDVAASQVHRAKSVKAASLPEPVQQWLRQSMQVKANGPDVEWSETEAYLAMPRPGVDAWVRIALDSGEVEYESTDRGWISYFNDLHKGRHAGQAWRWFIDIFAAACLVFSLTGLLILKFHAGNRPGTWPLVGAGIVIPLILALLFIH